MAQASGSKPVNCYDNDYIFSRVAQPSTIVSIGKTEVSERVSEGFLEYVGDITAKYCTQMPFNSLASLYSLCQWRQQQPTDKKKDLPTVEEMRDLVGASQTGGCCYMETKRVLDLLKAGRCIIPRFSYQERTAIHSLTKKLKICQTMRPEGKDRTKLKPTQHLALIARDVRMKVLPGATPDPAISTATGVIMVPPTTGSTSTNSLRKGAIVLDMDLTRTPLVVFSGEEGRELRVPASVRVRDAEKNAYGLFEIIHQEIDAAIESGSEGFGNTRILEPMRPSGTLVDCDDGIKGDFQDVFIDAVEKAHQVGYFFIFFRELMPSTSQLPWFVAGASTRKSAVVTSYIIRTFRQGRKEQIIQLIRLVLDKPSGRYHYTGQDYEITVSAIQYRLLPELQQWITRMKRTNKDLPKNEHHPGTLEGCLVNCENLEKQLVWFAEELYPDLMRRSS